MELKISENIKRLRKEKNLTQEALASMLSITSQSVSKWERGDGFPDITLLPAIANCLGVSTDVLLGNDIFVAEERIQKYISEYKNRTENEDTWMSAFTVAQNAYDEFSYDFRIMMLYVNALNVFRPTGSQAEIEQICKTVLRNCEDKALCADASYFLCGFRNMEDKWYFLDKYIQYGKDWNWFKVYPIDSTEGKIMMQYDIMDKWWHMNAMIYSYGDFFNEDPKRKINHEEKIQLIKKCMRIFDAYMDDDDYGSFSFYVGQYNEFLAREYAAMGMYEETIQHFEKAVEGWISYINRPNEYTFRNVLLDHYPNAKGCEAQGDYPTLSRYKRDIDSDKNFDFVRENERFTLAYRKLTAEE